MSRQTVSVEISGCPQGDARTVFDTLCACFASDRTPDDVPHSLHETRPTVWLGTFEVTGEPACPPAARLSAPVEVDAHGTYQAVDRLRATLGSLFRVRALTTASGDQERELHVVLGNLRE